MHVVVVGSINHDITIVTPRLPTTGETVLGTSHYTGGGGKGANQAVAAARLGSRVAMIGRVGDDEQGRTLRDALAAEEIDVSGVGLDPEVPTGLAVITVDEHAENTIVVDPGANSALFPRHLQEGVLRGAGVVLAQLEVPVETVIAAAAMCAGKFLLNPAPAAALPADLLERVDVLIPNRSELATLSESAEPETVHDAIAMVRRLAFNGPTVVTLGSDGALIVEGSEACRLPAPIVHPVDPTGAGDAFCGALAHSLAQGQDLESAVERAVIAGAIATTRAGAQASMPVSREVEAFTNT